MNNINVLYGEELSMHQMVMDGPGSRLELLVLPLPMVVMLMSSIGGVDECV